MPDGQFPAQVPQRPASALFPSISPQSSQPQPVKRLSPQMEEFESKAGEQISNISQRLKLVEQRIDNLRGHLELIDNSVVDKHKEVISEMRDVEDGMRSLRADIDMLKDLTERISKRMEALASREEVKVLQRYVELWQPLQFVTRSEVKTVVQNALKEQGIKIVEED